MKRLFVLLFCFLLFVIAVDAQDIDKVCNSAPGVECTSTTSVMLPSFRLTLMAEVFPTSTVTVAQLSTSAQLLDTNAKKHIGKPEPQRERSYRLPSVF